MSEPLILLAFFLVLPSRATQADTGPAAHQDPPSIVREATQAVEQDSSGHLAARWQARLQYDPRDRAAAIGLATIARLTYDYPTAAEYYRRSYGTDSARPDRHVVYARLGLAQGLYAQGRMQEADSLFARARADARALRDRSAEGEALFWLGTVRVL